MKVKARLWGLQRGFEPREGQWLQGVDAREDDVREKGDKGEDYQVDI